MSLEVLCIGHAAYDLSFFIQGFPAENSKCETEYLMESGGGPAANAAYLLSSWGVACGFGGVVGDDYYGRQIAAEFQSAGTDISLLTMQQDYATPLSLVLVNTLSGSRTIINRKARGPALLIALGELGKILPSVLLFDGHEPAASLLALRAFPAAISILDAGSMRIGNMTLADKVNYLVASEPFAIEVTGVSGLENQEQQRTCLLRLRQQYSPTVVVTMGERGLVADDGSGLRYLPAFPAASLDTTAAGDIFHGAFAYGILKRMPLLENLRMASIAAALSVARPGGRRSIPSLQEVQEALAGAQ
ncbi:MAG: PfkB family carbohydrate kinase [Acidobacteria bacterium]|nr:PfkB family carbohydrate kinase [Acidobacteriota bacterium]MCI0722776.1 PfkB family carbohydrate kinase [Acidobacteriota bacterium]